MPVEITGEVTKRETGYHWKVKLEHGPARDRYTYEIGGNETELEKAVECVQHYDAFLEGLAKQHNPADDNGVKE